MCIWSLKRDERRDENTFCCAYLSCSSLIVMPVTYPHSASGVSICTFVLALQVMRHFLVYEALRYWCMRP